MADRREGRSFCSAATLPPVLLKYVTEVTVQSEVVRYQVDDETVALIEVEPTPGFQPAGFGDVAGWVRESAAPAVAAARELLEQVKTVSPDAVEVRFGIKATGTASWVVAKATGEANFEVTLAWQPEGPTDRGAGPRR
ncbi:hypothetical protein GA0070215_1028 [Micromonospora marina]|uniref:Trypsin-co-occurring domain-containing protein n=2 Tax=Micromonosporaceae TaxID=28056 RepID=A0A1C4ULM9_9ACTN|nr:hypothetical protein GA0070215_1028 [Micromonospora marina]